MTTAPHIANSPPGEHVRSGSGATTLTELVPRVADTYRATALRYKDDGAWIDISYRAFGDEVREIAKGLMALGIERGDRVSILSNTRPEWTLADLGALMAGATVAPIYHTNSPGECRYVLDHSEARAVFVEDRDQLAKIEEIREDCPALEHVILLEGSGPGSLFALRQEGRAVTGEQLDERVASVHPNDVATIVYTSGTTGPPKGCMLTHANVIATMSMYEQQLDLRNAVVFMFLPLAHSLARVTQMVALDMGGTIAYWERDPARLLANLAEVRPTHFPSVPRVFEKIYTAATVGMEDQKRLKRAIAQWAFDTGRKARALEEAGRTPSALFRRRQQLADKLVLSKVKNLFGGQLKLGLTGAAPIAKEVLEFFESAGIPVLEGYGMTESCAASTLNTEGERRPGTVGKPLPGTKVRVAEDGEILMWGPHVFAGYYKDPEATSDTLEEGWLRTGDLGEIDGDGFVLVTGRKKDIIITSSGKNITPSNIENQLKENRWISEAVVVGDNRPYLVALVSLDPEEAPKLAEKLGVDPDPVSMAANPLVRAEIQAAVDEVNTHFARIEQIKKFTILPHELSQAGGELTPTLKVKRRVVHERYADVIDELYTGGRAS
ncbi:MAG TPA: long-chain fatty acid--CoA ligase [Thermoleophilaceae bacterium]